MQEPLDHIDQPVLKPKEEKEIPTYLIFVIGIVLLTVGAVLTFVLNFDSVDKKFDYANEFEVVMMLAGGLAIIAGLIRLIRGKLKD